MVINPSDSEWTCMRIRRTSLTIVLVLVVFLSIVSISAIGGVAMGTADDGDNDGDGLIESVERTVDTQVSPGETVEVEVTVELSEEATDLDVTENFDPAFADVAIVEDDGATISTPTNANDQVFGSWGSTDEVTLTYEVEIPDDAEPGDEFTIDGTVEADDEEATIEADTLSFAVVESADRDAPSAVDVGETFDVSVDVVLAQASDLDVNETFDPAFADVSIVDDDNATVSTPTEAGDELVASWGAVENVTLEYELTVSDDAEVGDQYEINGTLTVANTTHTIDGDKVTVSSNPAAAEYADEDGTVGAGGVGSAAADFRSGDLDAASIGDVAAAFRSGEAVL